MKKIVVVSLLLIVLVSCSKLSKIQKAEAKALKPYIEVLADTDTSFGKKKKELTGRKCQNDFPAVDKIVKTIEYLPSVPIEDTSKYKYIRDAAVNSVLNSLKDTTFTLTQMDSAVNNALLYFVNHNPTKCPPCKQTETNTTKPDTIGNWRKYQEKILLEANLKACKDDFENEVNAHNTTTKTLKELKEKQHSLCYLSSTLFKTFLKRYWWLLIIFLGIYVGGRYIKNNLSLITKFLKL
jgi:hypothetical protein